MTERTPRNSVPTTSFLFPLARQSRARGKRFLYIHTYPRVPYGYPRLSMIRRLRRRMQSQVQEGRSPKYYTYIIRTKYYTSITWNGELPFAEHATLKVRPINKKSTFYAKSCQNIWWFRRIILPLHSQLRNSAPVTTLIVWKFG